MDISLKARFLRESRGNTLPHLLRARGRKEGRRKKTFITESTYNNFRQQKSETGVQKL
jgi:hypothetical protein